MALGEVGPKEVRSSPVDDIRSGLSGNGLVGEKKSPRFGDGEEFSESAAERSKVGGVMAIARQAAASSLASSSQYAYRFIQL
jgi:hypothetical protein